MRNTLWTLLLVNASCLGNLRPGPQSFATNGGVATDSTNNTGGTGSTGSTGGTVGATTGSSSTPPAPPFPEAAHPSLLQVLPGSGSVIKQPTIQVVTFNTDAQAAQLEDFAAKLAGSSYWTAVTGEYGVAALTAATPLRETQAWPTVATDGDSSLGEPSDIENYLIAQLDGATPGWGAPNPSTVYTLFFPAGSLVSSDKTQTSACAAGVLSWHTALLLPTTKVTIHYVVVPDCGGIGSMTEINSRTFAASHALIEAVTDPEANGLGVLDPNHSVWQLVTGSPEVASACSAQQDGSANLIVTTAPGLPYAVQRSWSNASATAGHAPCVPIPAGQAYFDAVPVLTDTVKVALLPIIGAPAVSTAGVQLGANQNKTIALNLISDAAVGPWQVTATEVGTNALTLKLDKSQGSNGDVLNLTVAVGQNPAASGEIVKITSTLSGVVNNQYVLVHP